ncbi:MAG: creatininase family protein [Myxococcota bacterium]
MAIFNLAEMTFEELAAIDAARAVAILPVGATEAHGPHLPLATDVVIAEAMARAGGARLAARGRDALLLPPIAYSVARYAGGFAGTISIRAETASALIVDIARALAAHGIGTLAIANAHLEPAHIASLDAAVATIRAERVLSVAFPDVTRKPWALRLTDEFKSGACHAGRYEGSIVMAERRELVREAIRKALPANPASLSQAIRAGKATFEEAGGPRAYFGDPAAASAGEGRQTIDTLGAILEEAVLALGEP